MRRVKRTSFQLYFNRRVHFLMLLCPSSCIDELYVCLCVFFSFDLFWVYFFFGCLFVCFFQLSPFSKQNDTFGAKKERKNMPLVIFIFKVVPKNESSEHRRCLTRKKHKSTIEYMTHCKLYLFLKPQLECYIKHACN